MPWWPMSLSFLKIIWLLGYTVRFTCTPLISLNLELYSIQHNCFSKKMGSVLLFLFLCASKIVHELTVRKPCSNSSGWEGNPCKSHYLVRTNYLKIVQNYTILYITYIFLAYFRQFHAECKNCRWLCCFISPWKPIYRC